MRNTGPKCRNCRREGTKLFLKGAKCFTSKCPVARRPFAPGVHGPTQTRVKMTGFGTQLREKQKAKRLYGLLERQFSNYVVKASATKGNTGETLQQLLEMRLDNVVYRLGVAESRAAARQLVGHGHVLINGKKLDIPSYQVEVNDVVGFGKQGREAIGKRAEAIAKANRPSWLDFEAAAFEGKILSKPMSKDIEAMFDVTPIIEYYSR
ncbi:MAG: 30S ribosomal protein S4 [Candidatus Magasanikbacteria bacterium RIFCSPHIGHO2_01_FULL_50_8]|uniref:Small ribosomal subunit protein uS4 n=2 Tax=Candidatus Magasanikiibacteriota TaxID=1752731 RepID=A0A1F6LN95_9BACT|nr:MAG: 30S ribosomal protein S4 [Candidatus Magasanikbacteria bacterium RIFCSPHIGHO2_01_FULL_50_8]OGH68161.1 MAG: 30S ribosomal protein S4 [Candidatus Magasanikbacteria bacterium RIFCSPHIGHO2_02_FULL_50_9b]